MDKCRICLTHRKTLFCIFESEKGTSYAEIITTLANIKIVRDSEFTNKICRLCRRKLKEAYEFRTLIQKSDTALWETTKLKKFNFNNINEFKVKIELECDTLQFPTKCEVVKEYFKDGVNEICYSDTVIKKVDTRNDLDNACRKPIPVLEFLRTIKEEPDIDYGEDYEMDQYGPNTDSDDDYIPPHKLLKTENVKRKYKKGNVIKKAKKKLDSIKYDDKNKSKQVCLKPIYLKDLKLIYNRPEKSKEPKKQVYHAKLEICPYCGKMTRTLKSHLLQHTGERTFKCDQCGQAFFSKSSLNKHMNNHITTKNFKCEFCVAAFNNKASLKSHMLSHTEEKKHVCDICSKGFKRRATLRRHRMMHNSANKTVMCESCNMSFFTKYGLRHHMRIHTGERPYNCEICSQPYSYKHDFNRHCFKKHGVFLKRRSVNVMNEEVLKQEKILMRDLMLRVHGIVKDDKPLNPFDGPQAAQAFEQAVKAYESKQIPVDFQV